MLKFFQKRYALSPEGAKYLLNAIITTFFHMLSMLLPAIYAFIFLEEYITELNGGHLHRLPNIGAYIGLSVGMFVVMFLVTYIQYRFTYTKIYTSTAKQRIKMAEKIRLLPIAFFGKRDLVSFSATLTKNVFTVEEIFSHSMPYLYASAMLAVIVGIAMFGFDWRVALAMFWVIPVSLISLLTSIKKQRKSYIKTIKAGLKVEDEMQKALEMISEIKAYQYEGTVDRELSSKLDVSNKLKKKGELTVGVLLGISRAIIKLGMVTTAIAAIIIFVKGNKDIKDIFNIIVTLIASVVVFMPLENALMGAFELQYVLSNVEITHEMESLPEQTGEEILENNGYDIEFKNVSFEYEKGEETIKDISFVAKQGEVTALVGPSGGGKSTISKLAARFWDIDGGTITLGGADISKVKPECLLQEYSVVFQDVLLFNSSVLENIRMGRKDATDEEVLAVAKLANCDEFADKLPNGYNTEIGENGLRLSGGERQRISIARAMLKNAQVILLDEATASLDAENETYIQKALSELIKDKTVIVIAHRMRTVVNADKIVVVNNGQIEAIGTPKELMKKPGYFKDSLSQMK